MTGTDIIARGMAGNAKTTAEQAREEAINAKTVKGYFYDGSFYNDAEHTSLIDPEEGKLYYDYSGKKVYVYDGTQYSEYRTASAQDVIDAGKISTQQSASDAGKVLKIDEDGTVKPMFDKSTLVVTCQTKDGVLVTGQTVTVRNGSDESGQVYAQVVYNGQPVSISVYGGFDYYVSVSDTLYGHFAPTVAHGIASTPVIYITLTYSDISSISTLQDIKAALNADIDLSELVGENVTVTKTTYYRYTIDVAHYDPVEGSVWLMFHEPIYEVGELVYEPAQAFAWFETGLPVGAYYFYNEIYRRNLYFRLNTPVPAGGQLVVEKQGNLEVSYKIYADQYSTTAIGSGSISNSAIADAIDLGTPGSGNLNDRNRVVYGSNNFGESFLFAWLNSDAAVYIDMPRRNKFSRPYDNYRRGFLYGFKAADLDCLEDVAWTCESNTEYEAPSSVGGIATKGQPYTVTGKFGLATTENIGLTGNNPWDLFVEATNVDRIKYDGSTPKNWWLRSPATFNSYEMRVVGSDGSNKYFKPISRTTYQDPNGGVSVVPVCKIKKDVV